MEDGNRDRTTRVLCAKLARPVMGGAGCSKRLLKWTENGESRKSNLKRFTILAISSTSDVGMRPKGSREFLMVRLTVIILMGLATDITSVKTKN